MSPEANASILRIKADYPDVQWAQDMPNTVILWFDHVKAFVHLVGEEMDPPIELDEARARSALDALLGVTAVEEPSVLEPGGVESDGTDPDVIRGDGPAAVLTPDGAPVILQDHAPQPMVPLGFDMLTGPSNSAPTAPPVAPQPVPEGEPPAPQPPAEG